MKLRKMTVCGSRNEHTDSRDSSQTLGLRSNFYKSTNGKTRNQIYQPVDGGYFQNVINIKVRNEANVDSNYFCSEVYVKATCYLCNLDLRHKTRYVLSNVDDQIKTKIRTTVTIDEDVTNTDLLDLRELRRKKMNQKKRKTKIQMLQLSNACNGCMLGDSSPPINVNIQSMPYN